MSLETLGIVIVTHNNAADLPRCLDAVQQHARGAAVVVRDCNSSDDTAELAKSHPAVTRVLTGENVGFGTGCNEGVRALEGIRGIDMLLILNPDTELESDLADVLKHAQGLGEFGAVGIRQHSLAGDLVWSWDEFPSPALEWRKARKQQLLQRSPEGYTRDRIVDWCMGAFLLIPREAFDAVGGFDQRFFMFNEEVDLLHRLKKAGRPTWFVNEFNYRHDRSDKTSLWRETLRINARRAYDRKWLSRRQTALCQLAHSYRWMHDALFASKASDRRLSMPRLLATWNIIRAITPPESISGGLNSWHAVQPTWKR